MANIFSDMFTRISMIRLMEVLATLSPGRVSQMANPTSDSSLPVNNAASGTRPFAEIIREASEKFGVGEELISAVIQHESSFNAQAVSSCGAQGLMQLMPATAKSLGVLNPFDAEQNIMAGTRYLKEKLDEFGGNVSLALAAYNAGSGAVHKYAGVPPYKETQNYVAKVMKSIDYMA